MEEMRIELFQMSGDRYKIISNLQITFDDWIMEGDKMVNNSDLEIDIDFDEIQRVDGIELSSQESNEKIVLDLNTPVEVDSGDAIVFAKGDIVIG